MAKRTRKRELAGWGASTRVASATAVRAQASPSLVRRDWFWGLILVLFVLLAYTPIWHAGFIWDDDVVLTANPCIVGPLGLKEIWTTSAADICPLVLTTFWVEHALWGLAPLPYHLVNIVMHGACAVLLWRVLRSLRVQGAWLGAALWALHPVAVESVAWITEMKNTESALFFLLSIFFFLKCLSPENVAQQPATTKSPVRERVSGRNASAYALCLIFAALAMASKSSTVILPVVLCLCAWWIEGRWHWRNVARVVPVFLFAVVASALSIWTQGLQLAAAADPQWVRSWPQRLAAAGDAVWFYLFKLLWPDPLIAVYPRWQIDAGSWVSYLPLLTVIVLFSILWIKRRVWSRACFFAFAYFITALLPVLGLIDTFIFRFSLVFDHFQYLASIGPLALAAAGLARAWDFLSNSNADIPIRRHADTFLSPLGPALHGRRTPNKESLCDLLRRFFFVPLARIANQVRILASKNLWLQSAFCAALLMILGMASWQRSSVFRSEEILWSDTLAKYPDCWVGYNNLGNALLQNGQLVEAIIQLKRALEIYPGYAAGHYNLGVAFFQEGQIDHAIDQFRKAVEINPDYAEAHTNLGLALLQKGGLGDAIEQYQMAIRINPKFALAHANLGVAFIQTGQIDNGIAQFQEALRLNPNFSGVRDALAKAQALVGEGRK